MSANNEILIKKVGKKYKIRHQDADTGALIEREKEASSLSKAIEIAEKITEENGEIEYGIRFKKGF